MIEWSGGLNPRAVAGRLSVTKLTHKSCTGISASGIPRMTVKNMLRTRYQYFNVGKPQVLIANLTTSPIFDETVSMINFDDTKPRGCELTEISDKLFGVVVNQTSFFDGFLDGREI